MLHTTCVLDGPAAMDFLDTQWRELYQHDPLATPYQSPNWLAAWAGHLPHTITPVILAVQAPTGRALAALALAREDNGPGRTRYFPLSAPHAEYVRPIGPHAEDPSVVAALAFCLLLFAEDGGQVEMTDVPIGSGLGQCLTQATADGDWQHRINPCAEIRLPLDFDAMSRTTRRNHVRRKRIWKSLDVDHHVTYQQTRCVDELLSAYDVLVQLHQSRWEGHAQLPGALIASDADQWRSVLRHCGEAGATIATLVLDGETIASQLCLTRGTTCFSVLSAMDPRQQHLAPGHALLRFLATALPAEGIRTLDLGRTAPGQRAYKSQYQPHWSNTVSTVTTPHVVGTHRRFQ
ncbi:GNAT family N-acetyltransferase [Streptomyces sp. NPDC058371]|uniref:GNAT family N-acetyltransferase n=1 Tax=Streptomyces sp. NPDC058371 TaxID=3346463 RepID=UPI0036559C3E